MKTFLVVNVFLFISLFNQNYNSNDLKKLNLHGNVKSMVEMSFEGIDKFGVVSKNAKAYEQYSYLFNENGMLVEENGIDVNLYIGGIKISNFKEIYTYDDRGQLIEINTYDSEGSVIKKNLFEYNDKHELVEKRAYLYSPEKWLHRTVIEYEGGIIKREIVYGKLIKTKSIFNYNHKAQKIEQLYYKDDDLFVSVKYNYDEVGNMIEQITKENEYTQKEIFKYDKSGNRIGCYVYMIGNEYHNEQYQKYCKIGSKFIPKEGILETCFIFEFDKYGNEVVG